MIFKRTEEILVAARNKLCLALLVLATNACANGQSDKLAQLRQLPDRERVFAFHELDDQTKVELFFLANRRHPPYSGLHDGIAREGKDFLVRLRQELDDRGGVPEVLAFLNIAADMKRRGKLSHEDIQELRIDGICQLAKPSEYCPALEAKLLTP